MKEEKLKLSMKYIFEDKYLLWNGISKKVISSFCGIH